MEVFALNYQRSRENAVKPLFSLFCLVNTRTCPYSTLDLFRQTNQKQSKPRMPIGAFKPPLQRFLPSPRERLTSRLKIVVFSESLAFRWFPQYFPSVADPSHFTRSKCQGVCAHGCGPMAVLGLMVEMEFVDGRHVHVGLYPIRVGPFAGQFPVVARRRVRPAGQGVAH